ncbi:hypothetical protein BpHYR1_048523 [Brachionus plicatilis]|uniref:Uncharacterized protein n=1 Tax=Brachionus plicatilis TaxID=10195 RepID=A0A3M7Q7N7_BRAPC|nr:hypothetical protein BpHYR1_048523 [Brachionus plicatilis]
MFELENLASKAYLQHDDRSREPIIVDRFIRGLGHNRIQSELCQMETIETIQDVLDKANQLEVGFEKCKQIIDYKNSRNNGAENKNNNQYKRTDSYPNQQYSKQSNFQKQVGLQNTDKQSVRAVRRWQPKNQTTLSKFRNIPINKAQVEKTNRSAQNKQLGSNKFMAFPQTK